MLDRTQASRVTHVPSHQAWESPPPRSLRAPREISSSRRERRERRDPPSATRQAVWDPRMSRIAHQIVFHSNIPNDQTFRAFEHSEHSNIPHRPFVDEVNTLREIRPCRIRRDSFERIFRVPRSGLLSIPWSLCQRPSFQSWINFTGTDPSCRLVLHHGHSL